MTAFVQIVQNLYFNNHASNSDCRKLIRNPPPQNDPSLSRSFSLRNNLNSPNSSPLQGQIFLWARASRVAGRGGGRPYLSNPPSVKCKYLSGAVLPLPQVSHKVLNRQISCLITFLRNVWCGAWTDSTDKRTELHTSPLKLRSALQAHRTLREL